MMNSGVMSLVWNDICVVTQKRGRVGMSCMLGVQGSNSGVSKALMTLESVRPVMLDELGDDSGVNPCQTCGNWEECDAMESTLELTPPTPPLFGVGIWQIMQQLMKGTDGLGKPTIREWWMSYDTKHALDNIKSSWD
ncbi:hypothetical protein E2C01_041046 [Portunus trituberculatus]|uniref:Uncharacterized protein n=1 Tax=Portunus trituberculatus TaxID=210409 RepID=A0A5B7FSF8_PORTR|nr:hypothetical protein [Portunus trituberculatus]